MIMVTVFQLLPLLLIPRIVDGLALGARAVSADVFALLLALSAAKLLSTFRELQLAAFSASLGVRIRGDILELISAVPAPLSLRIASGPGLARMTNDAAELRHSLSRIVQTVLVSGLLLLGVLTMLIATNWRLLLIGLSTVPVSFWLLKKVSKLTALRSSHELQSSEEVHRHLQDIFSSWREVLICNARAAERRGAHRRFLAEARSELRSRSVRILWMPLTMFLMELPVCFVWLEGARQVGQGLETQGTVVAFVMYLQFLYVPVSQLVYWTEDLTRFTASRHRIIGMFASETEPVAHESLAVNIDDRASVLEAHELSFAYESGALVFEGVTMMAGAGEMVGIRGPSGVGKTSLARLLLGLEHPTSGRLTVAGQSAEAFRGNPQLVAYAGQDSVLFGRSILDNLTYGNEFVPHVEVIRLCALLGLHRWSSRLPFGYDTPLGEGWLKATSGGQKHRILLARALLFNPALLVLDEAFSSVDHATTVQALTVVRKQRVSNATILFSHASQPLAWCDRLFELSRFGLRPQPRVKTAALSCQDYGSPLGSQFEAPTLVADLDPTVMRQLGEGVCRDLFPISCPGRYVEVFMGQDQYILLDLDRQGGLLRTQLGRVLRPRLTHVLCFQEIRPVGEAQFQIRCLTDQGEDMFRVPQENLFSVINCQGGILEDVCGVTRVVPSFERFVPRGLRALRHLL